jgi:carboxypeptidase family protein
MADEALTPPSTPRTRWAGWKHVLFGEPLSRVQAIVGTLAGIVSITGALVSLMPFARTAHTGELVATVQDAGSHRSITDATIEVLTTQNDIVATLAPDSTGRATRDLEEGIYVVRVSHPRYAAEVRRIQVLSRQTVEIRANLRVGSSSPVQRAVSEGLRGVRRALRF